MSFQIPNDSPQREKKEIAAVQDDCVREEPDEIPCLMPFISVESMEDMIDPLMMDTGTWTRTVLKLSILKTFFLNSYA